MLISCGEKKKEEQSGKTPPSKGPAKAVTANDRFDEVVKVEKTIATLSPLVSKLASSAKNLLVPDSATAKLFTESVTVRDLGPSTQAQAAEVSLPLTITEWGVTTNASTLTEVGIWRPLFSKMAFFEVATFKIVSGSFVDGDANRFQTHTAFAGSGRGKDGLLYGLTGAVDLGWLRTGEEWKIASWATVSLRASSTEEPFFRDVLAEAIPSSTQLDLATRSVHERYISEVFKTGGTTFTYPKDYWIYVTTWDTLDQHPSIAVVDLDRDGWDDFYVTARWGRNQFWHNRGDGTFEEIAGKLGIDLDGMCNAAVFADFDNDGDDDLFVGRSIERSRYFRNEGGRFVDASTTHIAIDLPHWTSAVSCADYNGDGLLDVYLSTYRLPITRPRELLSREFLTPEQQVEWKKRRIADHPVFRLTGPPNVLLVNRGDGRFELAPEAKEVEAWLSAFQGTWSDFDNDGDPDLFIANDWAPDNVFRNDVGEDGKRRFVDVTTEVAGDQLQGFGMGVSLGDYDNDRNLDLFLTYMFSKAGSRITQSFEGLEKRMYEGAQGNKLFRGGGGKFELVSGLHPPALKVAKSGWSWGGQFADLDHNGFLDLYVANGYYTAPSESATEVDL